MWRNIQNVGALAERLGAVVAPPPTEDDDDSGGNGNSLHGATFHPRDGSTYYDNVSDDDDDEDNHDEVGSDDIGDDVSNPDIDGDEEEEEPQGLFGFMSTFRQTLHNISTNADGVNDDVAMEFDNYDDSNDKNDIKRKDQDAVDSSTFASVPIVHIDSEDQNIVEPYLNEDERIHPSISNGTPTIVAPPSGDTLLSGKSSMRYPPESKLIQDESTIDPLLSGSATHSLVQSGPTHVNTQTLKNNTELENRITESLHSEEVPNKLITTTNSFAESDDDNDDVDDEFDDDDEEDLDVEHTLSDDEVSLSDHSDLDGGDDMDASNNNGRPRVVARLQKNINAESAAHNQSMISNTQTNGVSEPHNSRVPQRGVKATYSTDSLLEGDFGRKLREQRRRKRRTDGKNRSNTSSSQSDSSPPRGEYTQSNNNDNTSGRKNSRGMIGATYSTDSLLEGDFGRKLREQRRRNRPSDGPNNAGTSQPEQPSQQISLRDNNDAAIGTFRPYHRIVEVPKNDELLQQVGRRKPSAHAYSDDEHDELDVPHQGKLNSPPASPHGKGNENATTSPTCNSATALATLKDPTTSSLQSTPTRSVSRVTETKTIISPRKKSEYASLTPDIILRENENTTVLSNESNAMRALEDSKNLHMLQQKLEELKQQMELKDIKISTLQTEVDNSIERDTQDQNLLIEHFKAKEQRLLEAATEDHQYQLRQLEEETASRIGILEKSKEEERLAFQNERGEMEFLLDQVNERAAKAEEDVERLQSQLEATASQLQQQHARVLRTTEDKLVKALAILDEKTDQEEQYKKTIAMLKSKMTEHHEGAQEVEEELEEIQTENEQLSGRLEELETENKQLREKVDKMQGDSDKFTHLKLEMRMLKEDNEREKAKRHNVAANAESTSAQLITDRDSALAEVQDLKQQLAAALADLEISKSDSGRATLANMNLQSALEAFQMERDSELSIWEENKLADEKSIHAAHQVALDAARQAHDAQMVLIQNASDAAVRNSMDEIKLLEDKVETYRLDNVQMRRSLDEAISRLQATQDDVIDRAFMKNVLLDWLTKKGVKERREVLEVLANILHFTEEEKELVHIGYSGHLGLGSIVGPLPEAKADMEHLEGDNVREKFVNFLLAETED